MAFLCSICGEESTQICVRCTKDACRNHLCDKCHRCSDCCECEVPLDQPMHAAPAVREHDAAPVPAPEAALEPVPEPAPVPDPAPVPEPAPIEETAPVESAPPEPDLGA